MYGWIAASIFFALLALVGWRIWAPTRHPRHEAGRPPAAALAAAAPVGSMDLGAEDRLTPGQAAGYWPAPAMEPGLTWEQLERQQRGHYTGPAPSADDWDDQALAELHDAPTVLDGLGEEPAADVFARWDHAARSGQTALTRRPEQERLADTGEIHLATLRADHHADLTAQCAAQDADVTDFCLRMQEDAHQFAQELRLA